MRYSTYFSKDIVSIFSSKNLEENEGILFLLTSSTVGNSEDDLGEIIMEKYLYTLSKFDIIPKTIILINKAVLLLRDKTSTNIYLKRLQDRGTEILVCKLSADYFKLSGRLLFGNLVDMQTIIEKQIIASKIIKI